MNKKEKKLVSYYFWYDLVRKKVREGIFPVQYEGKVYEVVHCYLDPFSGQGMLGLFVPSENRHVGVPAIRFFELNLINFPNNETEKAQESAS